MHKARNKTVTVAQAYEAALRRLRQDHQALEYSLGYTGDTVSKRKNQTARNIYVLHVETKAREQEIQQTYI